MSAPEKIIELCERFGDNRDAYLSGQYNETQARHEFIDPFFEALGWDMNNQGNAPEAYKDVIHEDSVRVAGSLRAPDYGFRTGGARRFFVEAKKPNVNLYQGIDPAFQLRRYAWSAKLPLSILTDFEEFVVYDCRFKPDVGDPPSRARIRYIPFTEYVTRWDEIAGLFGKQAVLDGSLDQYAASSKNNKGTVEVDEAFLAEIEGWRQQLAVNLAARNPTLTRLDLNYVVQATIDRIIFLRICEDRGIEDYGQLGLAAKAQNVYSALCQLFQSADARYNSGLFHFNKEQKRSEDPDDLSLSLKIDNEVLEGIIGRLYFPESPYEFSVLSADILGQVYEQFLGKVIRLTSEHEAVVDEKPEVKKAGGVYYTPTYIVDYIVTRTIGSLLDGKTPGPKGTARQLRVLDPACGSGSFLIAAYQYLLDWYLSRYLEEAPKKWTKGKFATLVQAPNGAWRLSTAERKGILLGSIYGVDIDPQAVEVTKLSLLLKVLEGESEESLGSQLKLFQERALPDLGNNIKCGNSLIDYHFYDTHQLALLADDEQYRINAFDWRTEFPSVFTGASAGFDAVVGNPPYIRIQTMTEWAPVEVDYYKKAYSTASKGNYDIYLVFVERAIALLNDRGRLGVHSSEQVPYNGLWCVNPRNAQRKAGGRHHCRFRTRPSVRECHDLHLPIVPGQSQAEGSPLSPGESH